MYEGTGISEFIQRYNVSKHLYEVAGMSGGLSECRLLSEMRAMQQNFSERSYF